MPPKGVSLSVRRRIEMSNGRHFATPHPVRIFRLMPAPANQLIPGKAERSCRSKHSQQAQSRVATRVQVLTGERGRGAQACYYPHSILSIRFLRAHS